LHILLHFINDGKIRNNPIAKNKADIKTVKMKYKKLSFDKNINELYVRKAVRPDKATTDTTNS
jgi:hypothetical protein